jgi:predicted dehydrogenase
MKILIYGFGRMGITHYSILNSLLENAKFTFVEPNKRLSFISRKNIHGTFLHNDELIKEPFDITLITTPPFIHLDLLERCVNRGDSKIFIEKPFGGHANFNVEVFRKNIFIGYVLRFNPIVNWVKININHQDIIECSAQYLSNTIEKKPIGWRNGSYSGVLNEMGSHIFDLTNWLFDIEDFNIDEREIVSVVSDVDDVVKVKLSSKNRIFSFHFNWVDKSLRKPVFKIELKLKDSSIVTFDQQKVVIEKDEEVNTISVVDIREDIPFYLRGVDFTKQMLALIGDGDNMCKPDEALLINKLMKEILKK